MPPVGISEAPMLVKWAWDACPPPSLPQGLQGDRGTHWLQSRLLVTENHFQKIVHKTHVKELFLYVFLCEFYSSVLFKSLTHFELSFVNGIKLEVQFDCLACGYPVFPTAFTEETNFSPLSSLGSLVED